MVSNRRGGGKNKRGVKHKEKKIKGYLAGVLTATIIFTFCVPSFASTAKKQLTATYNNIKLYVDGAQVTLKDASGNTVEPFIVDGTTYLPVRAVATALGKDVTWDGATQTVYIGEKPNDTASYGRTNPAPIGTEQSITVSDYKGSYSVKMKIMDSFRGQTAWAKIRETNRFNDEAPSGKEYILYSVSATVLPVSDDKAVDFSTYDFTPYSGANAEYKSISVVTPKPDFSGKAF